MKTTSFLFTPISQIPSKSRPPPISQSNNNIMSEIETILKTTPFIETPLERLVPRMSASVVASVLQQHSGPPQSGFRFFAWAMRRMHFNTWVSHNYMIRILHGEGENGFQAAWQVLDELKCGGIPIVPHVFALLMQAYAKSGRAVNAIESFGKMHEYKCRPNTFAYNTVIHILIEEKVFPIAMAVYNQMLKSHCPPNRATFNILIDGLSKAGEIQYALQLFDEMFDRGISPNTMTYTAVLSGHCQAKRTDDAHRLLHSMKKNNCFPDTITYNALLNGFCKLGQMDEAFMLLRSFRMGGYVLGLNGYSCLIDGLFRARHFEEACQCYRNMLEENISPDCILYTIMIKGYSEAGKVEDAFSFLSEMTDRGLVPDTFCYNTLIKGLCDAGLLDKARLLKLEISKQDCFPDSATYTIMICGLCKEGLVHEAQEIFDEMGKLGCFPTVMTFNALINGLCKAGELKKARDLLYKMETGRNPSLFLRLSQGTDKVHDSASLQMRVERLCDSGCVLKAYKLLKEFVDSGVVQDVITYNILINGFCKARKIDEAFKVFKELKLKGFSPDAVTYGALINGLLKVNREEDAFRVFERMVSNGCTPSLVVYKTLMTAVCRKGRVSQGLALWLKYISQKVGISTEEDKAIKEVQEHFESGDIEAVVRGLLAIDLKLKDVDPAPYTIWLIGLCRAARVDDACKIFLVLTEFDIDVTPPSCVALITGLCQEGWQEGKVALALDIFQYTMKRGFFLMPQICNTLIKCLCTNHKKKDAIELVRRMNAMGYDLDFYLLKTTKFILYGHERS
ncbi:hypothetical protein AAC387_Pa08g2445 [Persea americana]